MRRIVIYLHWLVGLIAGSLLIVIGASGALLAFDDQILDHLNPGVRTIAPAGRIAMPPAELLSGLQQTLPGQRISNLTLYADPLRSVKLAMQAERGAKQTLYVDPYSGVVLGPAAGQAFFDWIERLHRFLLLPREAGRVVAGTLSGCLLLLLFSGLYLRWPSRGTSLSEWFHLNFRLRGRPFVWRLHAVLATWVIPIWLMSAATGIYWAFDGVRSVVDGLAGVQRQMRPRQTPPAQKADIPFVDLKKAWTAFATEAGAWDMVRISLPRESREGIDFVWLPPDAPHERALNRMRIRVDGQIQKNELFVRQDAGKRALAAIYPLHMGRYFGVVGQLIVAIGGLSLAVVGLAGWWLYLQRKRQSGETERERARLVAHSGKEQRDRAPILIAYASQTGRAEQLALRTANCLQQAGRHILLRSLASLSPSELVGYPQALFIVSTYGDGQAPDAARGFAAALAGTGLRLQQLNYEVLALGNQQYRNFCGFGRFMHERLAQLGAVAQSGLHAVCDSEQDGFEEWFTRLARFGVVQTEKPVHHLEADPHWMECILSARQCLNPGSQGAALYEIHLDPAPGGILPHWRPGALLELRPRHAPEVVRARVLQLGLKDDAALAEVLACRRLPEDGEVSDLQSAMRLPMLAPRRYSVASIFEDGSLQLIVRQHWHAGELGLASGWLTCGCPVGASMSLRVLANPAFGVTTEPVPCLFIGAGSGLAGLRGLLRERMRHALGQNWLILGERQSEFDTLCAEELARYCHTGLLQLDRVFSRDAERAAYVQDCLRKCPDKLQQLVADGGHIHVCGSQQGMGDGVDQALREILGNDAVDALAAAGRYRRDVY